VLPKILGKVTEITEVTLLRRLKGRRHTAC
jgi:hypothetical protein